MDGTLLDSEPLHAEAWRRALAGHGVSSAGWAEDFVGVSDREIAVAAREAFSLPCSAEEILANKCRHFLSSDLTGLAAFEGVSQRLERLITDGIKMGLCTSGTRLDVEMMMRHAGLMDLFHAQVTIDDVTSHKPHPEPYMLCAGRLGLKPVECVVIEDSLSGFLSASSAGCTVILTGHEVQPSWLPPEIIYFRHSWQAIDYASCRIRPGRT